MAGQTRQSEETQCLLGLMLYSKAFGGTRLERSEGSWYGSCFKMDMQGSEG